MSLRRQIPSVYWYYCTIGDPLLSLSAVYMCYFQPSLFMDPGFAQSHPLGTITASHQFLLHQFAGPFMAWTFLSLTMLRETSDMKIWTRVQTALAMTDVAVLYSQYKALQVQGRLGVSGWRWEESVNAVIVGVILLIRIGFVAGWGFAEGGGAAKKKR